MRCDPLMPDYHAHYNHVRPSVIHSKDGAFRNARTQKDRAAFHSSLCRQKYAREVVMKNKMARGKEKVLENMKGYFVKKKIMIKRIS